MRRRSLQAMLPLTLKMEEVNGNEKKYDLSNALPTDSYKPKTINSGDLMIWGDRTLVFSTKLSDPYTYRTLDALMILRLEAAVGSGDVTERLNRSNRRRNKNWK